MREGGVVICSRDLEKRLDKCCGQSPAVDYSMCGVAPLIRCSRCFGRMLFSKFADLEEVAANWNSGKRMEE